MDRFYVTTPIYYINDVPHLGTAYTTILADVIARYHRLRGQDTWALTGTDEHGLKIERAAAERGMPTSDFADAAAQPFRDMWPQLACEFDDFIRTTAPRHKAAVQELWRKIRDRGDLYLGKYEGWYCVRCEAYYTERDLLPGNLCPDHKAPAERLAEPSYFFKLSEYQDRLLKFYEDHPDFVLPSGRMNEVKSFVKGGLEDISVSRTTFSWGVPVPDDEEHVMYVWFDALGNYWSALQAPEDRSAYWPPDVHLVGKDILRFHAVYWPAFLMAAGFELDQLPKHIFAHGWLTVNGEKMSKTLRNAVTPSHLLDEFEKALVDQMDAKQARAIGADAMRYYLARAVAFGQDGDFNLHDLIQRYNSELGNALGNLMQRVLAQSARHTNDSIPARDPSLAGEAERDLEAAFDLAATTAGEFLSAYQPQRAADAVWKAIDAANRYIDTTAPWALAKEGKTAELHLVLATAIDALSALSVMVWSFMPSVGDAMRSQLGLPPMSHAVGSDGWPTGLIRRSEGETLGERAVIFPKLDAKKEAAFIAGVLGEPAAGTDPKKKGGKGAEKGQKAPKAAPAGAAAAEGSADGTIQFDDFAKVELRVGVVKTAEKVPKKDRLLRLEVDLGEDEPRQIVAGLAESFDAEALVGRRVVVVANLAPRKFSKGLVSHGMLLAAGENPNLRLATAPEDVQPGTRLS
jgi:methionyl-tRNA synthetase